MDLSVNKAFKDNIKAVFNEFPTLELAEKHLIKQSLQLELTGVELKEKIIKWCEKSYYKMMTEGKVVKEGKRIV
jgi:SHS2 domain-containing protein